MTRAETQAKATELWATFDQNEQFGVRFGMFPAKKMQEAEREGFDGRELCVALMAVADKNGGMRA